MYGFDVIKETHIAELNTKATLFRHLKTGAELLSLENDDENKVFGITFRTPPSDSTGIAHIMEHSVLCGSRKYPLKEPFVELIKGSLKTFLNAFTYPDKTCYPVASQNTQDFYNLIDVYLDAVFYPLITPEILAQEGWHYELEDVNAPLVYKGVVFNEMKGAYSSPDGVLAEQCQQSLFPDHTYGLDSGGNPKNIPDLTYEQFKDFHQKYYHPGNARIYFYGDDDPETRLKLLNEYLQDFDHLDVDSTIPVQPPFDAPRYLTHTYVANGDSPDGNKYMLSVNWLMPKIDDIALSTALSILSYILLGTPASPLRKALIDSGLGEDLTGRGMAGHLHQMYFSTGLKGVEEDNVKQVEPLIFETLRDLSQNGIDKATIEAAMNTVEFRLREQNTGSFPRGLALMLSALTTWLYDDDPLETLAFEKPLSDLKANIAADDRFFEKLIETYLLQNTHRATLTMIPDPEQQQQEDNLEEARLAEAKAQMSQADLEAIMEEARLLKVKQETPDPPEALAKIPGLTLADVDKENKLTPLTVLEDNGHKILYHDLFTNGIVYLDIGFDMSLVPQDLLPYLPLFSLALLDIGTEKEDFVKLSQRIGRKTGGIWTSSYLSTKWQSTETTATFIVRGKGTVAQAHDLLDILSDVLLTVKLDNPERFKQIVLEDKAGQEASLIPSGSSIVSTRLKAHIGIANWAAEEMDGVSNLFFVRKLLEEIDHNWPAVLEKLEAIRQHLINRQGMFCNVTLDEANWTRLQPELTAFMNKFPNLAIKPALWTLPDLPKNEGLTIPAKVNYVGKGANIYELGYKVHGSFLVINNLLRTRWLWEQVRVRGGAYGVFCGFDMYSGAFTYTSYRDPNLLQTLQAYDQTGDFLRQLDLSTEEVTKTIIGAIGRMDVYQLPDSKGYTSMLRHLLGYSDEVRQQIRDEVLSTTVTDFKRFADVLDAVRDNGLVVVLGSEEAIKAASAEYPNGLTTTRVL